MNIFLRDAEMQVSSRDGAKIQKISLTLSAMVIILAFCAGNAWSFERITGGEIGDHAKTAPVVDHNDFSTSSPSAPNDACLPLLKSIRHSSAGSAMDRNQRSAGKAAALGLVFGIRFALKPSAKMQPSKPSLDIWSPAGGIQGNRSALAIADYRRCQKNKALNLSIQTINDFRWTR